MIRRNSAIRCDWSEKPHSNASSPHGIVPASSRARSKRRSRATAFGGRPISSRKRATIRLRLQPSSAASVPIGTRPCVARSRRHAHATSREGCASASRGASAPSSRAKRASHPGVFARRSTRNGSRICSAGTAAGQLVERPADESPRGEGVEVDLHAERAAGVLGRHLPIVQPGDERGVPRAVDQPVLLERQDDHDVRAGALTLAHRLERLHLEAVVRRHAPCERRRRITPDQHGAPKTTRGRTLLRRASRRARRTRPRPRRARSTRRVGDP